MAFVDVVVGIWHESYGWCHPQDTTLNLMEIAERARSEAISGLPWDSPRKQIRFFTHMYWDGNCQHGCAWLEECPFAAQYDHRLMAKDLAHRILPLEHARMFAMDLADAITQIRVYAKRLG